MITVKNVMFTTDLKVQSLSTNSGTYNENSTPIGSFSVYFFYLLTYYLLQALSYSNTENFIEDTVCAFKMDFPSMVALFFLLEIFMSLPLRTRENRQEFLINFALIIILPNCSFLHSIPWLPIVIPNGGHVIIKKTSHSEQHVPRLLPPLHYLYSWKGHLHICEVQDIMKKYLILKFSLGGFDWQTRYHRCELQPWEQTFFSYDSTHKDNRLPWLNNKWNVLFHFRICEKCRLRI